MTVPMRVCGACRAGFPATAEFFHEAGYKSHLRSKCRPCQNKSSNEYRRNKVGYKERSAILRHRRMVPCVCGGVRSRTARACSRCAGIARRGPAGKAWKGGRHTVNGYVKIYVGGVKSRQYEFEHRLVMEKELGRKLTRQENVHHRNGVRGDNRPENLELWVKTQPCGVRASDVSRILYSLCEIDMVGVVP